MKLTNDASFTNWEGMDSYLIDDLTIILSDILPTSFIAAVSFT